MSFSEVKVVKCNNLNTLWYEKVLYSQLHLITLLVYDVTVHHILCSMFGVYVSSQHILTDDFFSYHHCVTVVKRKFDYSHWYHVRYWWACDNAKCSSSSLQWQNALSSPVIVPNVGFNLIKAAKITQTDKQTGSYFDNRYVLMSVLT